MKKTTVKTKLVLHKETMKIVSLDDLGRAGGAQDGGTLITQVAQGCPGAAATPEPK